MNDQEITRLWSDDELDAALRELHVQVPDASAALSAARAKVLAAATGEPAREAAGPPAFERPTEQPAERRQEAIPVAPVRRRRRGPVAALSVGVAAALVAIGLVIPSFITAGNRPVNSAQAIGALNQAAVAALGATDEPVGPGQYRYIETHAWWTAFSGYQVFREEHVIRMWVPAQPDDPAQEWMIDRRPTGNREYLVGDEQQARDDGTYTDPFEGGVVLKTTAPCGAFYAPGTFDPNGDCSRPGSWQDPTPGFLAGLPRDPDQLYQRLLADAPVNSRGAAELFVYAADALRTGLVPADLRAALYQALTRIDGIELTDTAANLDGRFGTAIGIDDGQFRHDIIIDPATGRFIGEREVLTDDLEGLDEGTTMNSTAVDTAVVDGIGTLPTG